MRGPSCVVPAAISDQVSSNSGCGIDVCVLFPAFGSRHSGLLRGVSRAMSTHATEQVGNSSATERERATEQPVNFSVTKTSELRCAGDGLEYTWDQFVQYYGDKARQMWDAAGSGAAASADVQISPASGDAQMPAQNAQSFYEDSDWSEARAATEHPRAKPDERGVVIGDAERDAHADPQAAEILPPGALALPRAAAFPPLAAEQAWMDSHFVTRVLPEREERANVVRVAGGAIPPRARRIREALQIACASEEFLPLRAEFFYDGDICDALGCRGAVLVTAEKINHVRDPNRNGALRVDFVAYDANGSFTRYHPGATSKGNARPHMTQFASRTIASDIAQQEGAGAALHVRVPAAAAGEHRGQAPLCTARDLQEIHPLDRKLVSQRVLQAAMDEAIQQAGVEEVDWSTQEYPWWVFMAGRPDLFNTIVEEGIVSVTVARNARGIAVLSVTTANSQKIVDTSGSRVRIR